MKGGLLAIRSLQDLQTPDGTLTELGVCLAAFVVSAIFTTICYKGSRYFSPVLFPVYKTFKLHDQRDWDTRYSSYIHSVLIVYYAYRAIMVSDLYYRTDLPTPSILRTSHETYGALGMSLGYFVVDLAATLKYMMGGPEMALHHVGSFASVGMAIATGNCHLYTLWMLITEATTPFINLRWSLDKAGMKTSTWYLYNGIAILLSWILFRLAAFPPFFSFLWSHRAELRYIAYLSSFLLIVFPLILFGLNLFWFTKIVKGALKLLTPGKAKGKAAVKEE